MTQTNNEYAQALFSLSMESNTLEENKNAVNILSDYLAENPEYAELLCSPAIPKAERVSLLEGAFGNVFPERFLGFCALLCERSRMREFADIKEVFAALYEEATATVSAEIISAIPLSQEEKEKLVAKLTADCGKSVVPEYTVDPSILGGVIVKANGKIMDGSLRRRLSEVKEVIRA